VTKLVADRSVDLDVAEVSARFLQKLKDSISNFAEWPA
jgi:hypothetical protein